MAITQTAISYYGLGSVEQAARDFAEMKQHGCTTVILAVTEFDFDFWRPTLPLIVDKAHETGLRALIDPWGIGKYFGGEQVSKFLQDNIENRQVSALTGERMPNACFNTPAFIEYFQNFCLTLAAETNADGFFWDEPHYALPRAYASPQGNAGDDWTCRCPVCMEKFRMHYHYEMPRIMNEDVKKFRRREALFILADTSRQLKELKPELEITCCVHATLGNYYQTENRGYDDWNMVAKCPWFDVFSTTIINWQLPREFFEEITRRTVAIARKYHKPCERWIQGYFRQPVNFDQIDEVVDLYRDLGVDRLAAWTFRGGYGTTCAAPDPLKLWDRIGENYNRVLNKK